MNNVIQVNENYTIRAEMLDGVKYLVVPVVMMMEGVHNGSHGPLFHTAEELGKFPESWDGIPVIVQHPQVEGINVSANRPDVIESVIGRVFNTHMDGDKLKAEAWLDEQKLIAMGSDIILDYIRSQKPLDVSVGVFVEEEETEGEWNGETYSAIARNLRPDHLALLPGEEGACSWTDGCGIRLNKKGGQNVKKHEPWLVMLTNQTEYTELQRKVQEKLDSLDSGGTYNYLSALYDDTVVYEVRNSNAGESKFYKRGYSVGSDGSVTFAEEKMQVIRNVEYTPIAMNSEGTPKIKRTKISNSLKQEEQSMSNEKKPCCPDKVNALIANAKSKFTDEDKEWLLTLSAEALAKLEVVEEAPQKAPEITTDQAKKVIMETMKSTDDFISLLPKNLQDQMKSGLALHEAQRAEMIKTILDNSKDVWGEDELKAMDTEMLTKLSKSVASQVNYSPMGIGNNRKEVVTHKEEPMIPIEFEQNKN